MAVSLPPCGVKVTIVSPATGSHLRRGDAAGVRCRESSLEVVGCARAWKRKGQGFARLGSGGERRRCTRERCAVVRRDGIFHFRDWIWRRKLCVVVEHWCMRESESVVAWCAVAFTCVLNIYLEALKDAYPVSNISCPNHILCLRQFRLEMLVFEKLFHPGDFDASKLTVKFEDNANTSKLKSVEDLLPRKYTLTHSDVTGELLLSIGPSFNRLQLADWYTQLMRDEILAEWRGSEQISLHVHCHVSGGHVLLAPAALRNTIFEREMPLVLEAIRHGDKDLLAEYPELHASTVWVHFHSSDPAYNRADCWGPLFYAASPVRRVTGKLVPSCISEPLTPLTLIKVQKDAAELYSVMSP